MIIKAFKKLFPLFIVQFFTWFALFALWIYATPVITKYFFNTTNSESQDFENGTQWVSVCFALYATLAALLTFLISWLLKFISKERLHAIGLIIGSLGLLSIFLIRNRWSLMISFTFIGIAWSSISNIPYRIVSGLDEEGINIMTYFAVFNFSVVIPQIVASYILGLFNKQLFHNETIYIMLIGSISMFIAGILMFILYPGGKAGRIKPKLE
jgi:maltose/moltooligosaccharide transporter